MAAVQRASSSGRGKEGGRGKDESEECLVESDLRVRCEDFPDLERTSLLPDGKSTIGPERARLISR